jgi:hypothetical protein
MEAFIPCGRPLVAWPRFLLESKSRRFMPLAIPEQIGAAHG